MQSQRVDEQRLLARRRERDRGDVQRRQRLRPTTPQTTATTACWAGYSTNTTIAQNRIESCANGVSIEHGSGNAIRRNDLLECRIGVHLWWDEDKDLLDSAFGKAHPRAPSSRNSIVLNRFKACGTALRLDGDEGCAVSGNTIRRLRHRRSTSRATPPRRASGATASAPCAPPRTPRPFAATGAPAWTARDRTRGRPFPQRLVGPVRLEEPKGGVIAEPGMPPDVAVPDVPFKSNPAPSRFTYSDRRVIFVDEWGPIDPTEVRIMRPAAGVDGRAEASTCGDPTPRPRSSGRRASIPRSSRNPPSGHAPATIRIRPAETRARARVRALCRARRTWARWSGRFTGRRGRSPGACASSSGRRIRARIARRTRRLSRARRRTR